MDCLKLSRYYHRKSISYLITPSKIEALPIEKFALNDIFIGLIYSITLNTSLLKAIHRITTYVHELKSSLLYDSILVQPLLLDNFGKSRIQISYLTLKIERFQFLYDTHYLMYLKIPEAQITG